MLIMEGGDVNLYKEFFEMSKSQNHSLFGYANFIYNSNSNLLHLPSFQLLSIGIIIILSFAFGVLIGSSVPSKILTKTKELSKRLTKDRYHVDEENIHERIEETKVLI